MLEEISIKDLGVIENARLPFTKGLTVITGETGAGKTMVLTALSLLLGKRSDSSVVRHGSDFTSVEGCWNVNSLPILPSIYETGAVVEDGLLYVNRTVQKDGKSRAVLGGKTTPATILNSIGENLVSIHGQSDQIRLKNPAAQREALDNFAAKEIEPTLSSYSSTYKEQVALVKLIKELKTNALSRQREYEDLKRAVEEIEKVNPVPGEDDEIKAEISTLTNIESLTEATQLAYNYLENEEYEAANTLQSVRLAVKALGSVAQYDTRVETLYQAAETVQINLEELSSELSSYIGNIDTNALERLNEIQQRLSMLNSLTRKYGVTLEDVIQYWTDSAGRLDELDPGSSDLETLESELVDLDKTLEKQAGELFKIRTSNAKKLETAVNKELAGLAMSGNKIVVAVTKTNDYNSYGKDEVSFLLKTPGASEARPIAKASSGGELSRIMLSLELVTSNPELTPTFVFDEVDSGVGGTTAIEIGKRLARVAKEAQVIVVTHLPQVAAFADNHLRVLKTNSESFVSTDVAQLNPEERVNEVSRMLSGLTDSESGKIHALELLDTASQFKDKL